MLVHVSLDLEELLVVVGSHAPSDDVLVSVHKSVPTSAKLAVALVLVGDVEEHDRCSTNILKVLELFFKPGEHISRILELRQLWPVPFIAEVRIN